MLRGLREKDSAALDAAMQAYSRLLWSITRSILRNIGTPEDMEECVSDAFIQLWNHSNDIRLTRGSIKSWLCVVTRSKAIDYYRKNVRRNEIGLDEQLAVCGAGVFDQTMDAVLQRELLTAINALIEPDKEILLRRYYYRQKPKDIALALNLSIRQVENRLFRTKQQLKAQLGGELT